MNGPITVPPQRWGLRQTLSFIDATTGRKRGARKQTRRALQEVGADPNKVPTTVRRSLRRDGFAVIPDAMHPRTLERIRTRVAEVLGGADPGCAQLFRTPPETLIKNALALDDVVREAVFAAPTLSAAAWFLNNDLKLTYAHVRVPAHLARPQPLHLDTYEADLVHPHHYFCGVMWMLDDFTASNGATRFIAGSHRWNRLPPEERAVVSVPDEECIVTGRAGTAVVFDGHVWHGGGENFDGTRRAGLFTSWVSRVRHQVDEQAVLIPPGHPSRRSHSERWLLDL